MSEESTSPGQTDSSESEEHDPEDPERQAEADSDAIQLPPENPNAKYEDIHSGPFITPGSNIPENLLHFSHSFGYDSRRRSNLRLLDDNTLLFIAGNIVVVLDITTKEQRYLRSCSGGGIGAIMVHPNREYIVVAEKGNQPKIIVYEYPTLTPYRILEGGTEQGYSYVEFNADGSQLVSVGCAPDYMLTVWDWIHEAVMLSGKAISQDVYRVSFSPHNQRLLTSSGSGHIKFWEIAPTFTGLKLQGIVGSFGKTIATDIESYVDLPDGKVVSGTEWGNLLLWSGNAIKAEICRKDGQSCHVGVVQPFCLEDGQLMTIGSDGVIRGWDCEKINMAGCDGETGNFEIEPINEMVVGHNVCLYSVVRSAVPDSFVWFAQDSHGAIWKLDLSFAVTTPDPECLFTFHTGVILGLDISKKSHLMATTAQDGSVKVFDFLAKKELTSSSFIQGGTVLNWAPPSVNPKGALLVTGFQDGVVRLLEVYDPQTLHTTAWHSSAANATLRLQQAFKPHNAAVTAVAYNRNGEILVTGSADCTVFFFNVGEKYHPIGFIQVPGPVQALQWSPPDHGNEKLLILCVSGHVVEVDSPNLEIKTEHTTFQLDELPRRSFRFKSVKSNIKREEEIAKRQVEKEKRKEQKKEENELILLMGLQEEEEEEEEDELPPIYIPDPPSPLYCGFYSQPGQFWLSVGGFDSGFLYHCKFSENQDEDSQQQRLDEPFHCLVVDDADKDAIHSVTFSSNKELLLCGMHSGTIRIYPLEPNDYSLSSMSAYWALNVHDNHNGHVRHVCCSHDDLFVITAGDDGNIFSFSMLPPEELEKSKKSSAIIPLARLGLESEALPLDIEDPAAYSIETAKQKHERDQVRREAELKAAEKQHALAELQKKFRHVLTDNHHLPEHVRLTPEELLFDPRFRELAEKETAQQVAEVRNQFAWEEERHSVALRKLLDWFTDSLETDIVTVIGICTDHRISCYRLPSLSKPLPETEPHDAPSHTVGDKDAASESKKHKAEPKRISKVGAKGLWRPPSARQVKVKLGQRQEERLQKAAEKAELARAKIEKRKTEWAQLYAEKPKEDCEDPEDVHAIKEAKENLGDYPVSKCKRMNADKKKEQLVALMEDTYAKQVEMNTQITALHDAKVRLVSQLHAQAQQLQRIQRGLPPHLHRHPPPPIFMRPEETPEKWLKFSEATLERYQVLMEERFKTLNSKAQEEEGAVTVLEQLEKEMKERDEKEKEEIMNAWASTVSASSTTKENKETAELSEVEQELQVEEEIRVLYQQNSLLEQMESSVSQFDSELLLLHGQKVRLDYKLKLADFRLLTLNQEMLLLKTFERKEDTLQEKLNTCVEEEGTLEFNLEECNEQLEEKKMTITKLHEREKALYATFHSSIGENNSFEEFLTKVFKKKIKPVKKKKEQTGDEDKDSDSEEDSDSDESEDDYDSDEDGFDDSVCPKGCDPKLFDSTLQLRAVRLELEELLAEEKKTAETLKKEKDTIIKKNKSVKINRKAIEEDLEIINKEKQHKMNELDVVVAFRLHQIEFVTNDSMASDLSMALVLTDSELKRLQERIEQLKQEKRHEKERCKEAHLQHAKLIHDRKEMAAYIQVLESHCDELMMMKFGKLVDLEALQTHTGNRLLEELKQEKLMEEAANIKELKQWDVRMEEAQQALIQVTRCNTAHLRCMTSALDHKKEMEVTLGAKQKKMGKQQFQDYKRRLDQEEIGKLRDLVRMQSKHAKVLKEEISILSGKGGPVLPPHLARLHLHTPLLLTPRENDHVVQRRATMNLGKT